MPERRLPAAPPAVWAMLATPFTDSALEVDHRSLRRYCDEVVTRGCAGVVVLGVVGEPATLTSRERVEVVASALAAGVRVQVGLMWPGAAARAAEAGRLSAEFGEAIEAFLVPVGTDDPEVLAGELAHLHAEAGRPIVLQDYPGWSGVSIGVEQLAHAVAEVPAVTAVKCEAPPTFARIGGLRRLLPDTPLMSGLGGLGLVDDLTSGASLVACGTSRPEVIVAAARAWGSGDGRTARALVSSIGSTIGFETQPGTSIAIRKEHWRRQGVLSSSRVRNPTRPYEPAFAELSAAHGFPEPP